MKSTLQIQPFAELLYDKPFLRRQKVAPKNRRPKMRKFVVRVPEFLYRAANAVRKLQAPAGRRLDMPD